MHMAWLASLTCTLVLVLKINMGSVLRKDGDKLKLKPSRMR
jgi:hypothetical protein